MADLLCNLIHIMTARSAGFTVGHRDGMVLDTAAFLTRVAAWRALLLASTGNNFALYFEDTIEFGAALLGAWHAGKTVWLSADTLTASCAAMAPMVDGFLGEFGAQWSPLQPGLDELSAATAATAASATTAAIDAAAIATWPALDSGFKALVVHTSGTTGVAQAIPKRLSQLSSELATLELLFGPRLGQADIIATVSHQHIYGLLFTLLWPLISGRAIHARSQSFPEQLAPLLAARDCVLIASPAHLKRLPEHVAWTGAASNLRAVFSSGGPLPADVAATIAKLLGQTPIEVYGSSETGGVAWRQRVDGIDGIDGADESWMPLPQVQWRIAGEDKLLEVSSPHLYDNDWLRLADRVEAHGDGRFLLHGRNDRIVKIEEKRISLDAIEALLAASDLVAAARVLVSAEAPASGSTSAADDHSKNPRQRLAAFVVPSKLGKALLASDGKLALNRRLRAVLATAVEPVALPRRWRYLDDFPVNAAGKTSQAMLLALLEPLPSAPPRPRLPQVYLLEQSAHRVTLEMIVPSDLFYFDGHFSQAPILPGVVQVDWAIIHGRRYFDLPQVFRAIHALKFQYVIRPDWPVTLELVHDIVKGSLSFRYFSSAGQHASGRILFKQFEDNPAC